MSDDVTILCIYIFFSEAAVITASTIVVTTSSPSTSHSSSSSIWAVTVVAPQSHVMTFTLVSCFSHFQNRIVDHSNFVNCFFFVLFMDLLEMLNFSRKRHSSHGTGFAHIRPFPVFIIHSLTAQHGSSLVWLV